MELLFIKHPLLSLPCINHSRKKTELSSIQRNRIWKKCRCPKDILRFL